MMAIRLLLFLGDLSGLIIWYVLLIVYLLPSFFFLFQLIVRGIGCAENEE
jgi:hypothetical protein